jgi:hypothetical protein
LTLLPIFRPAERHLVDQVQLQRVRDVALLAAVAQHRVGDAQRQEVGLVGVAHHVAARERQTLCGPAPELEHHRVVHRVAAVLDDVRAAGQIGIGEEEIPRQPRGHGAVARARVVSKALDERIRDAD